MPTSEEPSKKFEPKELSPEGQARLIELTDKLVASTNRTEVIRRALTLLEWLQSDTEGPMTIRTEDGREVRIPFLVLKSF